MISNEATAQFGLPIGDFYCWTLVAATTPSSFTVDNAIQMDDQFKQGYVFDNFVPLEYCEAGNKAVFSPPMNFPTPYPQGQHYTTYSVSDSFNPPNVVTLGINNFDNYDLSDVQVGPIVEIWVPNDKTVTTPLAGSEVSTDQDLHYTCYPITSTHPSLNSRMTLDTGNFEIADVILDKPILLCNPAKKVHPNTADSPFNVDFNIIEQHLVCFDFLDVTTSPSDISRLNTITDQLVVDTSSPALTELAVAIGLNKDDKACFEATKVEGELGGSLIPINNVSLMLAGAQMFGAWIVPAIVAAAGIAIVVARKY